MSVGIITGSGAYSLPGFEGVGEQVETPYGDVLVTRGSLADVEVIQIARHGPGHWMLSSSVNHRANIWALKELGAAAVIATTACGAVDPTLELGSVAVFDDLWFLGNRLSDGSLCTFFDQPGDPLRGHWVLHSGPYSSGLRALLGDAATAAGLPFQSGGVYGHVDGPRFNTPVEIAALARHGVAAVSQTGGPETVLCGELELPMALVGYVTDYANEVVAGEPTPVATLMELIGRSPGVFMDLLTSALPLVEAGIRDGSVGTVGEVVRFGSG